MRVTRRAIGAAASGAMIACLALSASAQPSSWRNTVSDHLNQQDVVGAVQFLGEALTRMEADDKPEATALLAYLEDRMGDKAEAKASLFQFFETYGGPNVSFPYLGLVGEAEAIGYINGWRTRFPEISSVSIVWDKKNPGPLPPESLWLGVEVTNDALFRFSNAEGIMGGGMVHKGFNIMSLSSAGFFAHSGSHVYFLDLKSGDIIIRKQITISVAMTPEEAPPPVKKLETTKDMTYNLSLYVGDRLIQSSTKTEQASNPLKLNIKPVNLAPNPLFKPPGQVDIFDPAQNGISILDAFKVITGLVKDAFTKKPKKVESEYDRLSVLGLTFFRSGPSNTETEVKATVSLTTASLPVAPSGR